MQTAKHDWPVGRVDARRMLGAMALAALARVGNKKKQTADVFFCAKVVAEDAGGGFDERQLLEPTERR